MFLLITQNLTYRRSSKEGIKGMEKTKKGFSMIPNQLIYDKKLSNEAKILFCYIRSLSENYRITDFQCALGISQLKKLDKSKKKKKILYNSYIKEIRKFKEFFVPLKSEKNSCDPHWHLFPIIFNKKSIIILFLLKIIGNKCQCGSQLFFSDFNGTKNSLNFLISLM